MALTAPSLSPAIVVKEIDITGVAPNVDTSTTGLVGKFRWGPVNQITAISNEGELAEMFGTPDTTHAVDYHSAAYFLKYSGNALVVRAASADSCFNAVTRGTAPHIANKTAFEQNTYSSNGYWIARYPGTLGNSLAVKIFHLTSGESAGHVNAVADWAAWDYANKFDQITGTSYWATNIAPGTNTNDEMHVAVVDSDGLISGTKGTVLETFAGLSVAVGARTTDNGDNYLPNVINEASQYIYFADWDSSGGASPVAGSKWGTAPAVGTTTEFSTDATWGEATSSFVLGSGTDGPALTTGQIATAFDEFEDQETVDVSILVVPGMGTTSDQTTVTNDVESICAARKDCIAVSSPARDDVVNVAASSVVTNTLATTDTFTSSSYLAVDNNYLKVYDKFNDAYIYIPAASSVAGLMAATDANFGPWYSPAGEARGALRGVTALAHNPTKGNRDSLYKNGVNPIVQFSGMGPMLYGDKTKLSRPSAFDRINVRRLFLAIEKSIAQAARLFMFEFNDEFTRSEFVGIIEPLLREIQARRGIQDFYVQCDETNNTAAVIDRNELIASIYVKPARSINFITLNFVAVRSGVDFEEVVGRV